MESDPKSMENANREAGGSSRGEPANNAKRASGNYLLKFIIPGLLVVLIGILIIRYIPIYREKQKDIRQYNEMVKNYRMVEFDFFDEKDNPILKDEKYKDHREKEKFVREYNKLSQEIKASQGVEKARKLYNYLYTKYIDKKEYVEKQKRCVIYLEKDSTYSNPIFQSKSEIEMNKKKKTWKAARMVKSKFFKKHFIVEFVMADSREVRYLEYEGFGMPTTNNRIVAIDSETSIGYELSDNRGDWLEYMHEISGVLAGIYGFFEPMEGKIRAFNKVATSEGIRIGDEKEALEYAKYFIAIYYGGIECEYPPIIEPSPALTEWHRAKLDVIRVTPVQVEKKENYYEVSLCIATIRSGSGSHWFDYGEISSWKIKVHKDGTIEGSRNVMAGGKFMDVQPFFIFGGLM